jgi:hypothetical protein
MRNFALSSRTAPDGGFTTQSGSRGARNTGANLNSLPAVSSLGRLNSGRRSSAAPPSIPLPSGSIHSPVPTLKSLNLTQAVIDSLVVICGLFALAFVFGIIPFAVGWFLFS